jgi:hypothetical protein
MLHRDLYYESETIRASMEIQFSKFGLLWSEFLPQLP